jgi:outer membrane protein assembly factor BamB
MDSKRLPRAASIAAVAAAICGLAIGCGGSGAFALTSDDNNPELLKAAFALRTPPAAGKPTNGSGKAMAFLVMRANKKENIPQRLVAYDLEGKSQVWSVDTAVKSKVHVGRDFVAHLDGEGRLMGRDITNGSSLWLKKIGGAEFLGASADAERVYYVTRESATKPVWWLVALDGKSGNELWRADAPGQLGAPAAQGGLVFSPFLKQWLSILDARTGEQVARIRGIDEEISFVRTTSDNIYFGSKAGVFMLDERAASGKRAQSTYGSAELPDELRSHYYWDAFDKVQTGYSAYDRNRILWRGSAVGQGDDAKLGFAGDRIVAHTYRFFFAFDTSSGNLAWVYNHPRVDVIGSEHVGSVIAFASGFGELGALDPTTGERVYSAQIEGQLVGATFDADGWSPSEGDGTKPDTVAALTSIARDRDARFNDVKNFAVAALATLPGGEVTRDLLALINNERTPPKLYDKAVEVLVQRKDPAGLPFLTEALSVRHDFITDAKPRAVGVVARVIAAMGDAQVDATARGSAVEALLYHMQSPETSLGDLAEVIKALGAIGGGDALPAIRQFLVAYRADPSFSNQIAAASAAIDVLLRDGGARDREVVAFVAEDPRTEQGIAEYAQRALLQTGGEKK